MENQEQNNENVEVKVEEVVTEVKTEETVEKKPKKTLRNIIIVLVILGIMGAILVVAGLGLATLFDKDKIINEELKEITAEMNQTTPYMVDQVTRLDSVTVDENNALTYTFTIMGYTLDEAKSIFTETAIESQRQSMIALAKTSPELLYFRENDIDLKYVYKVEDGQEIVVIELPAESYI